MTAEDSPPNASKPAVIPKWSASSKRSILHVGLAIILILVFVDAMLFVMWLKAPSKKEYRVTQKASKEGNLRGEELTNEAYTTVVDFPEPAPERVDSYGKIERLCNTPACSWLDSYFGGRFGETGDPCDDFYKHACTRLRHSVYSDGRARLMVAVKDTLLSPGPPPKGGARYGADAAGSRYGQRSLEQHSLVLQKCLAGGPAALTASDISSGRCEETPDPDCPSRVPEAPAMVSEDFFHGDPNATVESFASFIERLVVEHDRDDQELMTQGSVVSEGGKEKSSFPKKWVTRACRWVSSAAMCHLRQKLKLPSDNLPAYQRAWKAMYFAPFMGPKAEPLLGLSYRRPPGRRLQSCLSIMADMFESATRNAVGKVLTETVDDLGELLSTLAKDVHEAMLPELRSPLAHGVSPRELVQVAVAGFHSLILEHTNVAPGAMPPFSHQVRFANDGQQLVALVAPGLLGLLVNVSSVLEPVLVPAFAKPLLRAVIVRRQKEDVSMDGLVRRLNETAQCLVDRLNISASLSTEVAEESAVLEPLFHIYGKRLNETKPSGMLLHTGYTNEQLFFVLWAQGHCGEPEGSAVVNAVAKNSARLAKAFRCGKRKAMFAKKRCHVNV